MLGLMIRLNNEVRDMGENGMHSNSAGGGIVAPPHNHHLLQSSQ